MTDLKDIHDKYHHAHPGMEQELKDYELALKFNRCLDCNTLIRKIAKRCAPCSDQYREKARRYS